MKFYFFFLLLSFVLLQSISWATKEPGQVREQIVGGVDVGAADPVAKSTVMIVGKIDRATFTCSGIIVDQDLVLTAGHCLGAPGWAKLTVLFKTDKGSAGLEIPVRQQERPDGYSNTGDSSRDDIALLELEQPIPTGYVPAQLISDTSLLQNGAQVLLAGYGMNVTTPPDSGDGGAGHLRKVNQKIIQADYNPKEILIDIHDKGSCFGDSGGPAYVETLKGLVLVGVASRLTERDRLPDQGKQKHYGCIVDMIYSSVFAQLAWIHDTSVLFHHGHK